MKLTEEQMRETVAKMDLRDKSYADALIRLWLKGSPDARFVVYSRWLKQQRSN